MKGTKSRIVSRFLRNNTFYNNSLRLENNLNYTIHFYKLHYFFLKREATLTLPHLLKWIWISLYSLHTWCTQMLFVQLHLLVRKCCIFFAIYISIMFLNESFNLSKFTIIFPSITKKITTKFLRLYCVVFVKKVSLQNSTSIC